MRRADRIKKAVVAALEDIKANNIQVLNVQKLTPLFDYMIVASADSTRQVKALANNVHDKMKDIDVPVLSMEGERYGEWVAVDLGEVVVHIMQPAIRQYYNLEQLWGASKETRLAKAEQTAAER